MGMLRIASAAIAACTMVVAFGVLGAAAPVAADPALEARVMRLSEELRCLVCQNQTLADSHAPLAVDLRNQVRDMLASGRSEREAVEYLVARYGDFVLYRPPLKATTVLLWGGPVLIVGFALWLAARHVRTSAPADRPAEDAAARRADALLGIGKEGAP